LNIQVEEQAEHLQALEAHPRLAERPTPTLAMAPSLRPRLKLGPESHLSRQENPWKRESDKASVLPPASEQRLHFPASAVRRAAAAGAAGLTSTAFVPSLPTLREPPCSNGPPLAPRLMLGLTVPNLPNGPMTLRALLPASASAPVLPMRAAAAPFAAEWAATKETSRGEAGGGVEQPLRSRPGALHAGPRGGQGAGSPHAGPRGGQGAASRAVTVENVWVRRAIDQRRVQAPTGGPVSGGGWSAAMDLPMASVEYQIYPASPPACAPPSPCPADVPPSPTRLGAARPSEALDGLTHALPLAHQLVTPPRALPCGADDDFYCRRVLRLRGGLAPNYVPAEDGTALSGGQRQLVRQGDSAVAGTPPPPSPQYQALSASVSAPTLYRPPPLAGISPGQAASSLACSPVGHPAGAAVATFPVRRASTLPSPHGTAHCFGAARCSYRNSRVGGGFGRAAASAAASPYGRVPL
jgi:hypothetical protein